MKTDFLMVRSKLKSWVVVVALATTSCAGADGQLMPGSAALIGGLSGAAIGAAVGGRHPMVATLIGAGVGSILGQMVQSLSPQQQQQRQTALQEAARGPVGSSSSWAADVAPTSSGSRPAAAKVTRARYVNKGMAKNSQGQSCSKVLETISMPDGKTGTAEQLVCPA